MRRRPLVAMALAWVLVVTAVAAVAFLVVDRAGRGVGQASAARTVAPLPSGSTSLSATDGAGGATAGPTARATAPVTPEATTPEATTPGPTASPRTASFTTQGGTVVATCTDATLGLVSITPRDGWRFEKEGEDGVLEVKFRNDDTEVELAVRCLRGVPTRDED